MARQMPRTVMCGNWRTAIRSRIALLQTYDTNNMVSHYEWKQKPYNLLCYKYHVVYSVECTVPKCTINRAQLTFEVKSVSAYQRQTATVSVNVCGLCVCEGDGVLSCVHSHSFPISKPLPALRHQVECTLKLSLTHTYSWLVYSSCAWLLFPYDKSHSTIMYLQHDFHGAHRYFAL